MKTSAGTQIAAIVATVTNEAIKAGWANTEQEAAVIGKMALQNIMENNKELWAAYAEEVSQTAA